MIVMEKAMDKNISLIINPCAGTRRMHGMLTDVVDRLNRAGYKSTVFITGAKGDATEYAAKECIGSDLVICSGGDGTFNEVVNGLMKSGLSIPIGYIPTGSTNDFANSLHLSSDIMTAVGDIINGCVTDLDIGVINGQYFSYVASTGIFTRTTYSTPQNLKNLLGHAAYVLEGAKDLTSFIPMSFDIECEEGSFSGEYILGAVCNSTSLGGVLKLDPDVVDLNDGLFELLFIRMPESLDELLRITNALSRKNYDCDMIDFVSSSKVTIKCEEPLDWTLDGELCRCGETVTIENIHNAIKVITPGVLVDL